MRIREARLQFSGLMAGAGQVAFMKLAFTNPDYLNVFADANRTRSRPGTSRSVKPEPAQARKPRHSRCDWRADIVAVVRFNAPAIGWRSAWMRELVKPLARSRRDRAG